MTKPQLIFKNFLSLSFAQVFTRGLGFVITIYLARILRVDGFGKIGFAQAILSYFMLLVNLGLSTFGTREIAKKKDEIQRYVNNILTMRLLISIIAYFLLLIFVCLINKPITIKKLILLYGLSIFTFVFTIDWVFQGIERMEFIAISQIVRQLVYLVLIFWIVKSPQQILKIPLLNFLAGVVMIFILISIFQRRFRFPKLEFDFRLWGVILKESLPMGAAFIITGIYVNLDRILLGFIKSDADVGWYNAAYSLMEAPTMIAISIQMAFFPQLSSNYNSSCENLYRISKSYIKIMFAIGVPFSIGGFYIGDSLILLVFGNNFHNSVMPFRILIFATMVIFINMAYGGSLLAWDRQTYYLKCVLCGACTNIILNFLLIPKFGMSGAAIGTLAAQIIAGVGVYIGYQRVIRINFGRYIWKPALSSLFMVLVIMMTMKITNNLPGAVFAGIFTYIGVAVVLKAISLKELGTLIANKEIEKGSSML